MRECVRRCAWCAPLTISSYPGPAAYLSITIPLFGMVLQSVRRSGQRRPSGSKRCSATGGWRIMDQKGDCMIAGPIRVAMPSAVLRLPHDVRESSMQAASLMPGIEAPW
jgi:hypothetical protein